VRIIIGVFDNVDYIGARESLKGNSAQHLLMSVCYKEKVPGNGNGPAAVRDDEIRIMPLPVFRKGEKAAKSRMSPQSEDLPIYESSKEPGVARTPEYTGLVEQGTDPASLWMRGFLFTER